MFEFFSHLLQLPNIFIDKIDLSMNNLNLPITHKRLSILRQLERILLFHNNTTLQIPLQLIHTLIQLLNIAIDLLTHTVQFDR